MSLEKRLSGWTGPSSATEQDKQERTERMIREAVKEHAAFDGCNLNVYAKGSYANNTNVKTDSDVDIAVQCGEANYWGEATKGAHPSSGTYKGIWTPAKLRSELLTALKNKFPGQVDSSGSTAFWINSNTARVDADVVPCFDYRYYSRRATTAREHGSSRKTAASWRTIQINNLRTDERRIFVPNTSISRPCGS